MSSHSSGGSSAAWIIGALVVVGLGFFLMRSPADFEEKPLEKPSIETAWVKGNKEAPVVIEEYSDFQCPACAAYAPVVQDIVAEFGNDVAVAYRHLPLKSIHPYAEGAALAAEAAGKQGKFWEMHDKLFENQGIWSSAGNPQEMFEKYAEELELNIEQFKTDMKSEELLTRVNSNISAANRLGLRSTPSFVINGAVVRNLSGADSLKAAVQATLDKARGDGMTMNDTNRK